MSTNSLGQNKRLTFGASQVVVSVISSSVFNLGMDVWAHLDIVYMWSWIFINEFKVEQWGGGSEENSTASDPWCLSFFSCSHLHFSLSVSLSISLFLSRSPWSVYFQHLCERIDIKTLARSLLSNSLCAMPKPLYVLFSSLCESSNLFSHYLCLMVDQAAECLDRPVPHKHTHAPTRTLTHTEFVGLLHMLSARHTQREVQPCSTMPPFCLRQLRPSLHCVLCVSKKLL